MDELRKWLEAELIELTKQYGMMPLPDMRARLDARCYQIERILRKCDELQAKRLTGTRRTGWPE